MLAEIKGYLLGVALVGVFVGGGLSYIKYLDSKITSLTLQNNALTEINKTNNNTIIKLNKEIENINKLNIELNTEYNSYKEESDKVKNILIEHNLQDLLNKKPQIIIKKINNGINNYNKQIQEVINND